MTFGDNSYVAVGEYNNTAATTNGNTNTLWLNGNNGIRCTQGTRTVFSCGPITSRDTTSFIFTVPVKARQFVTTSDARLKKDVRGIEGASSLLSRITPVSYELIPGEAPAREDDDSALATKASASASAPRHYGFLAQEVKEIFPELVVEDGDGMLGIDYNGFIPLLLDAVKGMQERIDELEDLIAEGGSQRKVRSADTEEVFAAGPALSQNRPNPFSSSTVIECNVPEDVSEAVIRVYDLQGKQLLRLDIPERGKTAVTIEASTLPAGMYIYSLMADGKELGTKRMIVTD